MVTETQDFDVDQQLMKTVKKYVTKHNLTHLVFDVLVAVFTVELIGNRSKTPTHLIKIRQYVFGHIEVTSITSHILQCGLCIVHHIGVDLLSDNTLG